MIYRYQLLLLVLLSLIVVIIIGNNYVPFITDEGWKIYNWVEEQEIINSQRIAGWDFAQIYRYYLRPFVHVEFNLNAFDKSAIAK